MLTPQERSTLEDILEGALEIPEKLTEWEYAFTTSLIEKLDIHGNDLTLSEKQWEVLHRIEFKLQ